MRDAPRYKRAKKTALVFGGLLIFLIGIYFWDTNGRIDPDNNIDNLEYKIAMLDKASLRKLTQMAEQGDVQAKNSLGFIYEKGLGVEPNIDVALRLYSEACEIDAGMGCTHAGSIYRYGIGVAVDEEKARYYFEKKPKDDEKEDGDLSETYKDKYKLLRDEAKDNPKKRVELAYFLYKILSASDGEDFIGVKRSEALSLLSSWANDEEPELYYIMGKFYNSGLSNLSEQEQDIEALKWFTKAAKAGYAKAQTLVGDVYTHGRLGTVPDIGEALKWLQQAADHGDEDAMAYLGELYYKGELVELNYEKAFSLFETASDAKNPYAMFHLARMYYNGQYVGTDCEKAFGYERDARYLSRRDVFLEADKKSYLAQCREDSRARQNSPSDIPEITFKLDSVSSGTKNNQDFCELYFDAETPVIGTITNFKVVADIYSGDDLIKQEDIIFSAFGMNSIEDDRLTTARSPRQARRLISFNHHSCSEIKYVVKKATAVYREKLVDLLAAGKLVMEPM